MEDELTIDLDILSIIRVIIKKFWIILYIAIICAIGTDVFLLLIINQSIRLLHNF